MRDKSALLQEAYRRGILPPEKKSLYEEAVRRGLISGNDNSFMGKTKEDLKKRGQEINQNVADTTAGKQTGIEEGFRTGASLVGGAYDVAGNAISAATPDVVKEGISKAGEYIGDTDLVKANAPLLKMVSQMGAEEWAKFKQENPRVANILGSTATIASAYPFASAGKAVAETGAEGVGSAGRRIADAMTEKELPPELASLQPVADAKVNAFFKKKPSDIKSGERANEQISIAYDKAKTLTDKANLAAQEIGKNVAIPAEDVYRKLDQTIGALKGNVAPESDAAAVLKQLSAIRDSLNKKSPLQISLTGAPVPDRSISANDLMEIEKIINSSLDVNKTTGADGKALNVKKTIQDALKRASEANPEFGTRYGKYKDEAINLQKTFTNNDLLAPFWQREDFVSWKAKQNNPNYPKTYNSENLSRISKTLDNLNTNDLGKISAVVNALPPAEARQLMRDAFIKAKKEKTSISGAISSLLRKNIRGVGDISPNTDLVDIVKDLNRQKVPTGGK